MTGCFEHARAGSIVERAMACSRSPACVCVALEKGLRLSPIVRDSRAFGLCLIGECSRLLDKKFGPRGEMNVAAPQARLTNDPFDAFEVTTLVTRSPILCKCAAAIDCEVIRHFDFDGDHELFVGRVVGCRTAAADPPGHVEPA